MHSRHCRFTLLKFSIFFSSFLKNVTLVCIALQKSLIPSIPIFNFCYVESSRTIILMIVWSYSSSDSSELSTDGLIWSLRPLHAKWSNAKPLLPWVSLGYCSAYVTLVVLWLKMWSFSLCMHALIFLCGFLELFFNVTLYFVWMQLSIFCMNLPYTFLLHKLFKPWFPIPQISNMIRLFGSSVPVLALCILFPRKVHRKCRLTLFIFLLWRSQSWASYCWMSKSTGFIYLV